MDHIDMVFTNACLPTSKFNPAVRAAIKIAKKTLNRYYSLTDASELYRIAMGKPFFHFILYPPCSFVFPVLHPRHKLAYFKAAGWTQEWIDTAEALVRDKFNLIYSSQDSDEPGDVKSEDLGDAANVTVRCAYALWVIILTLRYRLHIPTTYLITFQHLRPHALLLLLTN
jgi:hypothetical protein